MRAFLLIFLGCIVLTSPTAAMAQDCNARCCRKVLGNEICEPVCKSSCEAEKAARNQGVPVPDVGPSKVWEQAQKMLVQGCAAGFEVVTKAVLLNTGFQAAGDNWIPAYRQLLITSGIIAPQEFDNVSIRWCSISKGDGISPDRDQICLSDRLNRSDWYYGALLLAHEMTHIRQYRRMGTDNFKCAYTNAYINCRGCQDESHPLEAEAYQFQAASKNALENYLRGGGWHP